ncbi:MAG: nucleotide pyrophosphohydrolase [Clostridium lundense]|nr:nucleotide pyrophosphohydrolase [Clostridium lundense]
MEIKELVEQAHQNAKEHGFWEDLQDSKGNIYTERIISFKRCGYTPETLNALSTRLMLIVSELAEAQEGLRHNDISNFKEELADVAIRLGDLCGGLKIDLEAEILKKMAKNKDRPYKHGRAF